MADGIKISDLTTMYEFDNDDYVVVVDKSDDTTKKSTMSLFQAFLNLSDTSNIGLLSASIEENTTDIVSLSASIDDKLIFDLSELDADNTYNGPRIYDTIGESCDWGDLLYKNPVEGKWYKSNSENFDKMPTSAMALEDGSADEKIFMLHDGYARRDDWSFPLTGEKILYTGNTDGDIIYDPDLIIEGYSQPIGCVIASNIIKFTPSYATVEVT